MSSLIRTRVGLVVEVILVEITVVEDGQHRKDLILSIQEVVQGCSLQRMHISHAYR